MVSTRRLICSANLLATIFINGVCKHELFTFYIINLLRDSGKMFADVRVKELIDREASAKSFRLTLTTYLSLSGLSGIFPASDPA